MSKIDRCLAAGFVMLFATMGWLLLVFLVWASLEIVGVDTAWMALDYDGRSMLGPWPMRVTASLAVVGFWCFVAAGVVALWEKR